MGLMGGPPMIHSYCSLAWRVKLMALRLQTCLSIRAVQITQKSHRPGESMSWHLWIDSTVVPPSGHCSSLKSLCGFCVRLGSCPNPRVFSQESLRGGGNLFSVVRPLKIKSKHNIHNIYWMSPNITLIEICYFKIAVKITDAIKEFRGKLRGTRWAMPLNCKKTPKSYRRFWIFFILAPPRILFSYCPLPLNELMHKIIIIICWIFLWNRLLLKYNFGTSHTRIWIQDWKKWEYIV